MSRIELDPLRVDEILRQFDMHDISLMQRGILAEFADLLGEQLQIHSNTMIAFFYTIIKSWQSAGKSQMKSLEDHSPDERKMVVRKMVDELKNMLEDLLVTPTQQARMEEVVEDAFVQYQETWMNR
ncbi:MAG: hypothetical protein ACXAE3_15145 [Candidatus Kariarchaeaceae archaeon]|jgi:hypothetical protein